MYFLQPPNPPFVFRSFRLLFSPAGSFPHALIPRALTESALSSPGALYSFCFDLSSFFGSFNPPLASLRYNASRAFSFEAVPSSFLFLSVETRMLCFFSVPCLRAAALIFHFPPPLNSPLFCLFQPFSFRVPPLLFFRFGFYRPLPATFFPEPLPTFILSLTRCDFFSSGLFSLLRYDSRVAFSDSFCDPP